MPSSSYLTEDGMRPRAGSKLRNLRSLLRPSTTTNSQHSNIMSKNKSKSNVALLTEGQSYIARAKKERREQVESIKFDDDARRLAHFYSIADLANIREWLTGFSKRKKAKIEEKRSRAKERDHQAHLDERRKVSHLSMTDLQG